MTACSAALAFITAPAIAGNTKLLSGHVPAAVRNQPAIGRMPAETNLSLAIGLPLRNRDILTNLIEQIYDPASTNYHRYLSTEQFTERFGPTAEDYQKVWDFAVAHGLKVTTTHANRMLLSVSGRAADIETAFGLHLRVYRHPTENRTFFAPDTEPAVDTQLPVLDIMGLDNFIVPHPADLKMRAPRPMNDTNGVVAYAEVGSGPGGLYMGTDFPHAYTPGVTNTGVGQYIGLMEFGPYWTNDISVYQTTAHFPTNIVIKNVFLDGVIEPPSPGTDAGEQSLDIEMCMCMAPGATIIYYGGNVVNDILNRMATDNLAKQMSCSFGFGIDSTTEQIYQEFVAQGQDYFQASGDAGAYVGRIDPPAAEPYVTIVGGTALSTVTPNGAYQSETAWRGSGGGISTFYAIPNWQQGISMTGNQGSTTMRNFPDVAMMADTSIFIAANGSTGGVGGTSASSPLWAGFCALVNQQAASLGNPPVGFINPAIYAIGKGPRATYTSCFHDITTGNTTNGTSGPSKFFATTGYDLATGWGSPTGSNLITALVGTGTTNFMMFATPETVTMTAGGSAGVLITTQPVNKFNGTVSLSISGLPAGVTATFNPANTLNASTITLTAAGTASPGTTTVVITGTCGSVTQTAALVVTVIAATPGNTPVTLNYNVSGIYNDGSTFGGNGGMDGGGNAYPAGLLPSGISWNGCVFNRGPVNAADALKCARQTITLPPGRYSSLNLLAASVGGVQSGQIFTVTYTDGSTSTYTQSLSDWTFPQGLPGENVVATMAYRNTSGGTKDTVTEAFLYGYSYALNSAKSVSSVTLPGDGNVVVLAMALANDFTLSASPLSYNISDGGTALGYITAGPVNGFSGAVSLSVAGLPAGVTGTFSPASTSTHSVLSLKAGTSAPPAQGVVTIIGTMGSITHTVTASLGVLTSLPGTALANLSPVYNLTGIYADGTTFNANGGVDGAGNAFSANLLGTAVSWNGVVFGLGPANAPDAVQCLGQTISLPPGEFTSLLLLATAVNGPQQAGFMITYTDGATNFYSPAFSDWTLLQNILGDALVAGTAYANTSAGTPNLGMPVNLYGYSFGLNDRRTIQSITLPNDTNLVIFSLALANTASPVRLGPAYNRAGIYTDGTSFATGGLDGGGFAFSANQLGSSLIWNSALFNFGPSNTLNSIKGTGQTISLLATNHYTTLRMLATGVQGNQPAQSFVVTYIDGTSTTYTQSLSDWANPQNYAGEAVAAAMTYRDSSGGGAQAVNVNLYGYSFTLNNTRFVQSIRLPNNANVEVLALTLANSPASAPLAAAFNRAGIYTDGTKFAANAGIDNDGNALSATLLGSLVMWKGMSFTFGAANATNVISCAGQTVALPPGQYTSLAMLASAVNGNQNAQSFTVNYTSGTSSTFSQSMSDWANSQNFSGESNLVKMAYRVGSGGGRDTGTPVTLYGYTFNLVSNNVVQSIKLPNNPNVEVLAISLGNATLAVPEPPAISLQPVALAITNGGAAVFSVYATGSPALGYVWRFNGTNLANGGNVSGATTSTLDLAAVSTNDVGNYDVIIANAYGSVTSHVAALTVVFPPSITTQPQSLSVTNGTPVSFVVTAIGTQPLVFQWQKGGTNLTDGGNIIGSATDELTLSTTTTNDAGDYTVVITNAYGSVTSSIASLTVISPGAPPTFQSVTLVNGTVNFTWSAIPGQTYQLEFSTDLSSGVWNPIGAPVIASGNTLTASDSVGTDPRRFYRVVVQ